MVVPSSQAWWVRVKLRQGRALLRPAKHGRGKGCWTGTQLDWPCSRFSRKRPQQTNVGCVEAHEGLGAEPADGFSRGGVPGQHPEPRRAGRVKYKWEHLALDHHLREVAMASLWQVKLGQAVQQVQQSRHLRSK